MRINKIVCDGCGKEILESPITVFAERVDRITGDFVDNGALYASKEDLCDECFEQIKNFIETIGKKETLAENDMNKGATR